jgi:hypothetical protein
MPQDSIRSRISNGWPIYFRSNLWCKAGWQQSKYHYDIYHHSMSIVRYATTIGQKCNLGKIPHIWSKHRDYIWTNAKPEHDQRQWYPKII